MLNIENPTTTLAIDTSCDETSASVVCGTTILSNVLPSQMKYHKKFGGVVPSLAKFAHEERIDNVVNQALKKSGVEIENIDAIAVTIGPGLAIALEVGIRKAKELARKYNKPLLTINHMEGHLLSALAKRKEKNDNTQSEDLNNINFPVLGFLISGGHTELILVEDFHKYTIVGETQDDSCGEAYDKCGRIIGLGYPAGPVISQFAKLNRANVDYVIKKDSQRTMVELTNQISKKKYQLPIPMTHSGNLNFSYSGLKTAFKYLVHEITGEIVTVQDQLEGKINLKKDVIYDLCSVFEASAIEQLKTKLTKALVKYKAKEVWLGGGVVASQRVRSELRKVSKLNGAKLRYPYSKKLTTDNAAMIGIAANLKLRKLGNRKLNDEISGVYFKDFDSIDRIPNMSL